MKIDKRLRQYATESAKRGEFMNLSISATAGTVFIYGGFGWPSEILAAASTRSEAEALMARASDIYHRTTQERS